MSRIHEIAAEKETMLHDAARLLGELMSEEGAKIETWDQIKDWLKEYQRATC